MKSSDSIALQSDANTPADRSPDHDAAAPISLKQIRAFLAVVESRSITKAAERLHLSQPGLSRVITQLESVVGERLFIRSPSGLSLSATGSALLPYAHRLQTSYEDALATTRTDAPRSDDLTVACTELIFSMILAELMVVGASGDPGGVRWRVNSMNSFQVISRVEDGLADLGLCMNVDVGHSLHTMPLLKAPLGILTDPRMPLPASIRSLSALKGIRMARLSDDNMLPRLLGDRRQELGSYFDAAVVSYTVSSLIAAVRSGKVATIASAIAASLPEANGLRFTPMPGLLPAIELQIVARKDSPLAAPEAGPVVQLRQAIHQIAWSAAVVRERPDDAPSLDTD
jgi:LysR family transcriptional regulator, nitrogen assimilation regulatory protein